MRIGFALPNPYLAFWAIIGHAIKERSDELGDTLAILTTSNVADQVRIVDRFVDQRVDALIVGPVESHGLAPSVQRAIDAGIPVVVIDIAIQGVQVACMVGSDNVAGARLAAEYLAERLGGRGDLVHLQGPLTSESAVHRSQGFRDVLSRHPDMRVVFDDSGDWTRESGARLMRAALAAHPGARAVFAGNDTMALGALDEIAAAGRAGEILVVGFDAAPDALRALHSGGLAATVRQLPRDMGRMAVDIARRAARGEAVPALVHTGVALITADNLMEAVLDALEIFPAVLGDLVASGDALSEERTMLRTVIDALPDTRAFAKDRAGRFIIANAAHLAALGANRLEDVVGKSDFDLSPADLAAQSHDDEQAVMESGQPVINRVDSVVTPAGGQHWYLTSKVPLRDTSGAAVGLVGMSQDITALKRAEEDRAKLQEEVIRAQEMALRELSTPLIPINDQVMVMPLVGALDSRRAQQILETLLHGIADSGAQIAILDITGVPVVDTHVANALIHAAQSVRLLGAQVVLSGIRPEVAQTLVGLGIDLGGIATSSTLQNAIAYAMRKR